MHLGNPVHHMLVQLTRLSCTGTLRPGNIAYAIKLQSAEAGLAAGRGSLVLPLFCCCPRFYVSASVYAATSQTRSGNQSGLKHSGAGEVSAGSVPLDGHISIREGMAQ